MKGIELIEGELSEAEAKALDAAFASRDEDTIDKLMSKLVAVHALKQETERLKLRVMQDVLVNAHWLMHERREGEALSLLCPIVAMIEGDVPPPEVVAAMRAKLLAVNGERERDSCEGNA